jgi:hypothetical protein
MTARACAVLVVGATALWFDLGNRLFGSCARTPVGASMRITLVVLALLALGSPLLWLWIDSTSRPAHISVRFGGIIGAIAFVHYLFPNSRNGRDSRSLRAWPFS